MLSCRQVLAGQSAIAAPAILRVTPARAASLMTPATATIAFAHHGTDTVIRPSFIEFLWRRRADGEVSWHFETDTKRTGVGDGTFVGPGVFRKGSATGILCIDFGQNL